MKFLRDIIQQKSAEAEQAQAEHAQAEQAATAEAMTSPDPLHVEATVQELDTDDNDWDSLFEQFSRKPKAAEAAPDLSMSEVEPEQPAPVQHAPAMPEPMVAAEAMTEGDDLPAQDAVDHEDPTEIENMFAEDEPQQPEPVAEPLVSAAPQVPEQPAAAPMTRMAMPPMRQSEPQPAMQQIPTPPAPEPTPASAAIEVPPPAAGRGAGRAGRARTRILGFNPGAASTANPFEKAANAQSDAQSDEYTQFPVGWLTVIDGPGRGASFTLFNGVAQIGRGEGQTVRLDFGDNSISRENHAAIAFDAEENTFFIGHGGKANLVRCNGMPVLSTQPLSAGDKVRIGETTLLFTPLCGPAFSWNQSTGNETQHVARG